ncbi:general transcription factor II-I repeat domain-containing protein 2A [Trichonephila clavipes]|nr:general transcription factor II-I repeat domain-containing protein 2A [Trichonephila clavipes]
MNKIRTLIPLLLYLHVLTKVLTSLNLHVWLSARYCIGNFIKEELIAITSLLETTKGTDICTAERDSLAEKDIDLKNIVSVTTDGAPNMVGKKNSFVYLFKTDVGHSILEYHCIIHQQALCAKSGLTSLDNVIMLVTKIVNLISSQALNKRKCDSLLDEVNLVYNGLLMYNKVCWLSRGNVLQRFVDCLEEIRLFLQNENKIEQYPQLIVIMWLLILMFFTGICQHFNELNVKLQGPNKTIIVMMDLIRAFEAKLWYEKENGDCKTELAAGTLWNLKQEPALITDPIFDVIVKVPPYLRETSPNPFPFSARSLRQPFPQTRDNAAGPRVHVLRHSRRHRSCVYEDADLERTRLEHRRDLEHLLALSSEFFLAILACSLLRSILSAVCHTTIVVLNSRVHFLLKSTSVVIS